MDGIQRRGIILAYLMQFKQICNHPAQYTGNGDFDPAASGKFDRLAELARIEGLGSDGDYRVTPATQPLTGDPS